MYTLTLDSSLSISYKLSLVLLARVFWSFLVPVLVTALVLVVYVKEEILLMRDMERCREQLSTAWGKWIVVMGVEPLTDWEDYLNI